VPHKKEIHSELEKSLVLVNSSDEDKSIDEDNFKLLQLMPEITTQLKEDLAKKID